MAKLDFEKTAEALGWTKTNRLGKEVWYDPSGGHVSREELPAAIEDDITSLINEARSTPLNAEDVEALEKLGVPKWPS